MAPKMECPSSSIISTRMLSPNDMKGVDGLPSAMISSMRISAKQDAPTDVGHIFGVGSFQIRCRLCDGHVESLIGVDVAGELEHR